jgi:hypothetical protein
VVGERGGVEREREREREGRRRRRRDMGGRGGRGGERGGEEKPFRPRPFLLLSTIVTSLSLPLSLPP